MSASSESAAGGGCLAKLSVLFLLVGLAGLGSALYFMVQPQDLSDIGGCEPAVSTTPVRDLKTVLQSSVDRGFPVTLTETEINRWLSGALVAKQSGLLAGNVEIERVCVRLEDGLAEIVIVRKVLGKPFTVSMFLKVDQYEGPNGLRTEVHRDGGPYHENLPKPPKGGRFGGLVVPQGFLLLVLPSFEKLAALFEDEIHLGFEEMARIKIEKDRLVLNPREPSDDPAKLPDTF
jgi:hypothetical protein